MRFFFMKWEEECLEIKLIKDSGVESCIFFWSFSLLIIIQNRWECLNAIYIN